MNCKQASIDHILSAAFEYNTRNIYPIINTRLGRIFSLAGRMLSGCCKRVGVGVKAALDRNSVQCRRGTGSASLR